MELKIKGYKGFGINNQTADGVAIFHKYDLTIEHIAIPHNDILAIKVITNTGPVIISTAYSPPRSKALPIVSLKGIVHLWGVRNRFFFIGSNHSQTCLDALECVDLKFPPV